MNILEFLSAIEGKSEALALLVGGFFTGFILARRWKVVGVLVGLGIGPVMCAIAMFVYRTYVPGPQEPVAYSGREFAAFMMFWISVLPWVPASALGAALGWRRAKNPR